MSKGQATSESVLSVAVATEDEEEEGRGPMAARVFHQFLLS